ncbi:alternate-type signal peptide domain-containing protein [Populibacterium corticicola]|uniref:Alternate-type signal peptide domain-containing protein n=1 Tax=Populibacterium corticicola TaxID=1812826 RepID=A0ABW5XGN7_9MICO
MSKHAETPTGPKKSGVPILAIAAGAALLLSGGSTLAYWSVEQSAALESIQTGDLNLVVDDATWELNGTAISESQADNLKLVPGDTVEITLPLDITLVGDNLSAELSVADSGIVASGNEDISVTTTISGLTASGTVYPVTPATLDPETSIAAVVTIDFDATTSERDSTDVTINLDELEFTLTQVPTP